MVRNDILLGPAERADVIVDFHGELGRSVILQSVPRADGSPVGIGTPSTPIMAFRVMSAVSDTTRIPSTLTTLPSLTVPPVPDHVWTLEEIVGLLDGTLPD